MSYYAKDCIQMFFIGLIPSLLVKQGAICWFGICFIRYLWVRAEWKNVEKNYCKTKKEFNDKGFYPPDNWFDENGNYIKKW